jgi:diguanylate cyclase (GGDEF)-like protein
MLTAPKPINERARLAAVLRYDVLDTEPEQAYDDIVELASQICDAPISFISFVDADRLWFKARINVPDEESPRDTAFCAHTILGREPMVVNDLSADPRFADSELVTGGPQLRFYAGAPLITGDGHALGTLCALDTVPRELTEGQRGALEALSRQVVAQLELRRMLALSQSEALTDELTKLGNRRRLAGEFERLRSAANAATPLHLMLFDLDGFKQYNDTFGHVAGDALLARLARKLSSAATARAETYRIGGDEFCALARCDESDAPRIESAIAGALTERGERFLITASRGRVSLPTEADTLTRALQLADQRMYSDKAGRARGAGTQTHAVLTRILDECDPALHSHASVVTELASAVGRCMGLDDPELGHLARAAALHDIGKVAIPDAILDAPRALTEEEWELMRTHTILGERVLAAAPALSTEAALVRSSHERWDGTGYPDRLKGPEIPLGSRIILACDAFDAMTSPRSYQTIRSPGAALAELRQCAGSQFDPDVVAALADVLPLLPPTLTADNNASVALAGSLAS